MKTKEQKEFVEYSMIYSALFNEQLDEKTAQYPFNLEIEGYILNIELENALESEQSEQVYQYIKETVSEYAKCVVGPDFLKRVVVFIEEDIELTMIDSKTKSIMIAQAIQDTLREKMNFNVAIGIGGKQLFKDICISYEQALRCLRIDNEFTILHIDDLLEKNILHKDCKELEAKILEDIRFGSQEALQEFMQWMEMIKSLKYEIRCNKLIELFVLACHEAKTMGISEDIFLNYMEYFEEMKKICPKNLEEWASKKFRYIINIIRIHRIDKKPGFIYLAMQYIEIHLLEDLSLNEVAKYVGVSPQYFSKVFKEEQKVSFVEWVTNLRIKKAKELLNDPDVVIKEVCYRVGYHDPNYFSRLFKKTVGVTPTTYAKKNTNKNN